MRTIVRVSKSVGLVLCDVDVPSSFILNENVWSPPFIKRHRFLHSIRLYRGENKWPDDGFGLFVFLQ